MESESPFPGPRGAGELKIHLMYMTLAEGITDVLGGSDFSPTPTDDDHGLPRELQIEFNALGASCMSGYRSVPLEGSTSVYFDDKMTLPYFNVDGSDLPASPIMVILFGRRSKSLSSVGIAKARLPGTNLPEAPNPHTVDLLTSQGKIVGQLCFSYTFELSSSRWIDDLGIRDGQQGSREFTIRVYLVSSTQITAADSDNNQNGKELVVWEVGCPGDTQALYSFEQPLVGGMASPGNKALGVCFDFGLKLGDLERYHGLVQFCGQEGKNAARAECSVGMAELLEKGTAGSWYDCYPPGFEDINSGQVWISVVMLEENERSSTPDPGNQGVGRNNRLRLFVHALDVSGLRRAPGGAYYLLVRVSCPGTRTQRRATRPAVTAGRSAWDQHLEVTVDPAATPFASTAIHFEICDASTKVRKARLVAAFHMNFENFFSKLHGKGNEFSKKVFRLKYTNERSSDCAKVRLSILGVLEEDIENASKKIRAFQKRTVPANQKTPSPGAESRTLHHSESRTLYHSDSIREAEVQVAQEIFNQAAQTYKDALTRKELFDICKRRLPGFQKAIADKVKSEPVRAVDEFDIEDRCSKVYITKKLLARDDDSFGAGRIALQPFVTWWLDRASLLTQTETRGTSRSQERGISPLSNQDSRVSDIHAAMANSTSSLNNTKFSRQGSNYQHENLTQEDLELQGWQMELVTKDLRNLSEATDVAEKLDPAQAGSIVKSLVRNRDSLLSSANQLEEEVLKLKASSTVDMDKIFSATDGSALSSTEAANTAQKINILLKALKGFQTKATNVSQRINKLEEITELEASQNLKHQQMMDKLISSPQQAQKNLKEGGQISGHEHTGHRGNAKHLTITATVEARYNRLCLALKEQDILMDQTLLHLYEKILKSLSKNQNSFFCCPIDELVLHCLQQQGQVEVEDTIEDTEAYKALAMLLQRSQVASVDEIAVSLTLWCSIQNVIPRGQTYPMVGSNGDCPSPTTARIVVHAVQEYLQNTKAMHLYPRFLAEGVMTMDRHTAIQVTEKIKLMPAVCEGLLSIGYIFSGISSNSAIQLSDLITAIKLIRSSGQRVSLLDFALGRREILPRASASTQRPASAYAGNRAGQGVRQVLDPDVQSRTTIPRPASAAPSYNMDRQSGLPEDAVLETLQASSRRISADFQRPSSANVVRAKSPCLTPREKLHGIPDELKELFLAAAQENKEGMESILKDNQNLVVQIHSRGMTTLHFAAKRNEAQLIELLMQMGADLHHKDQYGKAAYEYTKSKDCLEKMTVLNAKKDPDAQAENSRRLTVRSRMLQTVAFLVEVHMGMGMWRKAFAQKYDMRRRAFYVIPEGSNEESVNEQVFDLINVRLIHCQSALHEGLFKELQLLSDSFSKAIHSFAVVWIEATLQRALEGTNEYFIKDLLFRTVSMQLVDEFVENFVANLVEAEHEYLSQNVSLLTSVSQPLEPNAKVSGGDGFSLDGAQQENKDCTDNAESLPPRGSPSQELSSVATASHRCSQQSVPLVFECDVHIVSGSSQTAPLLGEMYCDRKGTVYKIKNPQIEPEEKRWQLVHAEVNGAKLIMVEVLGPSDELKSSLHNESGFENTMISTLLVSVGIEESVVKALTHLFGTDVGRTLQQLEPLYGGKPINGSENICFLPCHIASDVCSFISNGLSSQGFVGGFTLTIHAQPPIKVNATMLKANSAKPKRKHITSFTAGNQNNGRNLIEVGSQVEARYQGGMVLYPGIVHMINTTSGTYDIQFDDGEYEAEVPLYRIKQQGQVQIRNLQVGMDVDFRSKRKHNNIVRGVVVGVDQDDAYSIQYNDGLVEHSVARNNIFAPFTWPPGKAGVVESTPFTDHTSSNRTIPKEGSVLHDVAQAYSGMDSNIGEGHSDDAGVHGTHLRKNDIQTGEDSCKNLIMAATEASPAFEASVKKEQRTNSTSGITEDTVAAAGAQHCCVSQNVPLVFGGTLELKRTPPSGVQDRPDLVVCSGQLFVTVAGCSFILERGGSTAVQGYGKVKDDDEGAMARLMDFIQRHGQKLEDLELGDADMEDIRSASECFANALAQKQDIPDMEILIKDIALLFEGARVWQTVRLDIVGGRPVSVDVTDPFGHVTSYPGEGRADVLGMVRPEDPVVPVLNMLFELDVSVLLRGLAHTGMAEGTSFYQVMCHEEKLAGWKYSCVLGAGGSDGSDVVESFEVEDLSSKLVLHVGGIEAGKSVSARPSPSLPRPSMAKAVPVALPQQVGQENAGGVVSGNEAADIAEEALPLGTSIEARYAGGKDLYAGKIAAVFPNGTYKIQYDDGEREDYVPTLRIKLPGQKQQKDLEAGTEVECRCKAKDNTIIHGTVAKVLGNMLYDVRFDDGSVEEGVARKYMFARYVWPESGPEEPAPASLPGGEGAAASDMVGSASPVKTLGLLHTGKVVRARYAGGTDLYKGKIAALYDNGTADINYDDGETERNVPLFRIKLDGQKQRKDIQVGEEVDAKCSSKDNQILHGRVVAASHDSMQYDVQFDDGTTEKGIGRKFMFGAFVSPQDQDGAEGLPSNNTSKAGVDEQGTLQAPSKAGSVPEAIGLAENATMPTDTAESTAASAGNEHSCVSQNVPLVFGGILELKKALASGAQDRAELVCSGQLFVTAAGCSFILERGGSTAGQGYGKVKDEDEGAMARLMDFIKGHGQKLEDLELGDADMEDIRSASECFANALAQKQDIPDMEILIKDIALLFEGARVWQTVRLELVGGRPVSVDVTDPFGHVTSYPGEGRADVLGMVRPEDPVVPVLNMLFELDVSVLLRGLAHTGMAEGTSFYQVMCHEEKLAGWKYSCVLGAGGSDGSDVVESFEVEDLSSKLVLHVGGIEAGKSVSARPSPSLPRPSMAKAVPVALPQQVGQGNAGDVVSGNKAADIAEEALPVGTSIEARYAGGKDLYAGKIAAVFPNGTYKIQYDDGEWEDYVPTLRIKLPGQKQQKDLEAGTEVECRCKAKDNTIIHGTVAKVLGNMLYDVRFDDGSVEEGVARKYMFARYVWPESGPEEPAPASLPGGEGAAASDMVGSASPVKTLGLLHTGKVVRARYAGGTDLYKGTIAALYDNGTADINYDDGETERNVPLFRIKLDGQKQRKDIQVGEEVDAKCSSKDNQILHGRVVAASHDSMQYDVQFDDGTTEKGIGRKFMFGAFVSPQDQDGAEGLPSNNTSKAGVDEQGTLQAPSKAASVPEAIGLAENATMPTDTAESTAASAGNEHSCVSQNVPLVFGGILELKKALASGAQDRAELVCSGQLFVTAAGCSFILERGGSTAGQGYGKVKDEDEGAMARLMDFIKGHGQKLEDLELGDADMEDIRSASECFANALAQKQDIPDMEILIKDIALLFEGARVWQTVRLELVGGRLVCVDVTDPFGHITSYPGEGRADVLGMVRPEDPVVPVLNMLFELDVSVLLRGLAHTGMAEGTSFYQVMCHEEKLAGWKYSCVLGAGGSDGSDVVESFEVEDLSSKLVLHVGGIEAGKSVSARPSPSLPRPSMAKAVPVALPQVGQGNGNKQGAELLIGDMVSGNKAADIAEEALPVGTSIEARYAGGKDLYAGKITAVFPNGTYKIQYDDGEREDYVPSLRIKLPGQRQKKDLEVGTEVECRCKAKDNEIIHGTVAKVLGNMLYDVRFDDGSVEEGVARKYMFARYVWPESGPEEPAPASLPAGECAAATPGAGACAGEGADAAVKPPRSSSQPAVATLAPSGSPKVETGDAKKPVGKATPGAGETVASGAEGLSVGTIIEARYAGGKDLYAGKITAVFPNGTFKIQYDDGEREDYVPALRIKLPGQRQKKDLEAGTEVECRSKAKDNEIIHGTVAKVLGNMLYDVRFDDGSVEEGVARKYMFARYVWPESGPGEPAPASLPAEECAAATPGAGASAGEDVGAAVEPPCSSSQPAVATPAPSASPKVETGDAKKPVGKATPGAGGAVASGAEGLSVGTIIEARYAGGKDLYAGKITAVFPNGTYKIQYDDGEREDYVPSLRIKLPGQRQKKDLEVGTEVECRSKAKDNEIIHGTVAKVLGNMLYDVRFDDGSVEEGVARKYMFARYVWPESGPEEPAPASLPAGECAAATPGAGASAGEGVDAAVEPPCSSSQPAVATPAPSASPKVETGDAKKPVGKATPGAGGAVASGAEGLSVGTIIEARYAGGKDLYAGKITAVFPNGTYKIQYDDGEREDYVPSLRIKLPGQRQKKDLEAGTEVECRCKAKDNEIIHGTVAKVLGNMLYDVRFDDGSVEESVARKYMFARYVWPESGPEEPAPASLPAEECAVAAPGAGAGEGVDAVVEPPCSSSQPAVATPAPSASPKVETGDAKKPVGKATPGAGGAVASGAEGLSVGTIIEARYAGGKDLYAGKITAVFPNGTYKIQYDDGEREDYVPFLRIKLPGQRQKKDLEAGTEVECRCKAKDNEIVHGTVAKVLGNMLYDVRFDDGSVEEGVARKYMFARYVWPESEPEEPAPASLPAGECAAATPGAGASAGEGVDAAVEPPCSSPQPVMAKSVPGKEPLLQEDSEITPSITSTEQQLSADIPNLQIRPPKDNGAGFQSKQLDNSSTNDDVSVDSVAEHKASLPSRTIRPSAKSEMQSIAEDSVRPQDTGAADLSKSIDSIGDRSRAVSEVTFNPESEAGAKDNETVAESIDAKLDDSVKGGTSLESKSPLSDSPAFKVGERIEARFQGGPRLFPGCILKCNPHGKYDIEYDDGEKERLVPGFRIKRKGTIQPEQLAMGMEVDARCLSQDNQMYHGVISKANRNGTYDVKLSSGGYERQVPRRFLFCMYQDLIAAADSKTPVEMKRRDSTKSISTVGSDVKGLGSPARITGNQIRQTTRQGRRVSFGHSSDSNHNNQPLLQKGTKVEARHQGGPQLFPGIIKFSYPDNTYKLLYDDGDTEMRVPRFRIKLPGEKQKKDLLVGDEVDCRSGSQDNEMAHGKILRSKGSKYDVELDDGSVEKLVERKFIFGAYGSTVPEGDLSRSPIPEERSPASKPLSNHQPPLKKGEKVEARHQGGPQFFTGTIKFSYPDNTYKVLYDDGDTEMRVPRFRIKKPGEKQPKDLMVGMEVDARCSRLDNEMKHGRILKCVQKDMYDVELDSGDVERGVERRFIFCGFGETFAPSVEAEAKSDAKQDDVASIEGKSIGSIVSETKEQDQASSSSSAAARPIHQPNSQSALIEKGTRIEARYQGGPQFFPGSIAFAYPDNTYKITYDDGEKEMRVPRFRIKLPGEKQSKLLKGGDEVDCRCASRDNEMHHGLILKGVGDTYDVKLDDGFIERKIERRFIFAAFRHPVQEVKEEDETKSEDSLSQSRPSRRLISDKEDKDDESKSASQKAAPSKNGSLRPRTVGIRQPSTKKVVSGAEALNLVQRPLEADTRVECRHQGGPQFFPGLVKFVYPDNTYKVLYDDGDSEVRVLRFRIKLEGEKQSKDLQIGCEVDTRCASLANEMRHGVIVNRNDSLYDIRLDDGRVERGVERRFIFAAFGPNGTPFPEKAGVLSLGTEDKDEGAKEPYPSQGEEKDDESIDVLSPMKPAPGKTRQDTLDTAKDDDSEGAKSARRDAPERQSSKEEVSITSVRQSIRPDHTTAETKDQPVSPRGRLDSIGTKSVASSVSGHSQKPKGGALPVSRGKVLSASMNKRPTAHRVSGIASEAVLLEKGAKVEARYQGGPQLFPGSIKFPYPDDTYKILYDDGETEMKVPRFRIKLPNEKQRRNLAVGDEVDTRCASRDNEVCHGRVTDIIQDGVYDIKLDDGHVEHGVERKFIFGRYYGANEDSPEAK